MGRKAKTHFLVKRSIDEVLAADGAVPPRPMVISGNDTKTGHNRRVAVRVHETTAVSRVTDQLLRIETEADPLGFLIAVQRGDLVPVHVVTDSGDVVTSYQQADLRDRLNIAKFMANKLLPSLSITKHLMEVPDPEGSGQPGAPGQPSFAAMVSAAASRRQMRPLQEVAAKEVKEDEKDGGPPDPDPSPPAGTE